MAEQTDSKHEEQARCTTDCSTIQLLGHLRIRQPITACTVVQAVVKATIAKVMGKAKF